MQLNLICPPIDLRDAVYMQHDYINVALNIQNIIYVKGSMYKAYPDEEGTPAISFTVVGKDPVLWLFPKHRFGFDRAVALRDHVLDAIERGSYSADMTTTQYLEIIKLNY